MNGEDIDAQVRHVEEFQADVLHGHYAHHAPALRRLARRTGVPFTVRAHSYDLLAKPAVRDEAVASFNDDLCLGVLTFPFTVDLLLSWGVSDKKVVPCRPVVDVGRFADTSVNGDMIMNVGACLPKKNHELFIDLARSVPERTFNLYAMGYESRRIAEYNRASGNPVVMHPLVEHRLMPTEYKKHRWLVYTASAELRTVGWPMAVAEAQAAGVGVCMQNIRPDLKEYVGSAGFLFDSLDEVADIIAQPFPDDRRELGFRQAGLSDINHHLPLLESLWTRT
ncbi:glycosyltransferase [Streptomyces sp. ME02-8801-2C]|uniref:glycosyltransferase n=1 Tax=Streptomyces sp. ME02-8801-2C TaxID=3028680 RepID=UPI0029AB7CBE|nr:glycosyltransferase [Streptomyces sp. ME02-8801-2C]MDX3458201.1 glycosyltransferase [Streptomyces sp. ME02-8801-2C]